MEVNAAAEGAVCRAGHAAEILGLRAALRRAVEGLEAVTGMSLRERDELVAYLKARL